MPSGADPLPATTFLKMSDDAADLGIVQDILHAEPGSSWRWTGQHPSVKVWVDGLQGWNLHVRFTFAGVIRKQVGPITIRFFVNNHELGSQRFDREQQYEYVKAVPAALLKPGIANVIALDLDRVYVSPKDGVKLGILLQEIGLKRAGDL